MNLHVFCCWNIRAKLFSPPKTNIEPEKNTLEEEHLNHPPCLKGSSRSFCLGVVVSYRCKSHLSSDQGPLVNCCICRG